MLKHFLIQELSQILVAIGDKSASQEMIEEQNFHDPPLHQANLEVFFDYPCKFAEDTKEPWITFDGEHALKHDIEQFLTSLCPYSLCKSQILKDL